MTEVKADGGRIRILYDDDTSEMADFPDGDIIVDAEENGKHSKSAGGNNPALNPFIPPPEAEEEEEAAAATDNKDTSKISKVEGAKRVKKKCSKAVADDSSSNILKNEEDSRIPAFSDPPQQQKGKQEDIVTTKKKKLKLRISAKSVSARLSSSSNDESGNLDVDSDDEVISKRKSQTKDEPLDNQKSDQGTVKLKIHKIEASSPHVRAADEGRQTELTSHDLPMPPIVEDSVSSAEPHDETTVVEDAPLADVIPPKCEGHSTPKIIRASCSLPSVEHYAEGESLPPNETQSVDVGLANELMEMSRIFSEQSKCDEKMLLSSPIFRTTKETSSDTYVIQSIDSPVIGGKTSAADVTPSRQSTNGTNMSKHSLSPMPSFEEALLASPDTIDKEVTRPGRGAPKKGNKRGKDVKDSSARQTNAKRKANGQSPVEGDNEENDENWVQCDRCQKWRFLPEFVDMDGLPERWFCEMNKYDPKRNKCNAPEQTVKEISEEREKLKMTPKKRRRKSQECKSTSPDIDDVPKGYADVTALSLKRTQSKEESIASLDSEEVTEKAVDQTVSPRTTTTTVTPEEAATDKIIVGNDFIPQDSMPCRAVTENTETTEESQKMAAGLIKKSKEADSGNSDDCDTTKGKGSRNRRKKEKDPEKNVGCKPTITARVGGKQAKEEADDSQEWVQCEKCDKWRRLPPRIKAEDLPDVWYCSMNTWDVRSASCAAPEDKAEAGTRECTILGGADNRSGGGKLTYRNLIFGSGKKQSRPTSERARALDSIFIVPGSDIPGEGGHPTVSYADSSCFVQRGISQRTKLEETSSAALLELMSKSRLWGDLYSGSKIGRPSEHFSSSLPENQSASYDDDLNQKTLESMKALVFHALGENSLSTHEVLLEAQCRNWGGETDEDWSDLRGACNLELIDLALKELVKDGIVEEIHGCLPNEKLTETKVTRYRRVNNGVNNTTRCIKLAKPWKCAVNSGKHCRWSDAEECEELLQQAMMQARKRFDFLQMKLGPQIPLFD